MPLISDYILENIKMSCNICLESGDLIHSCTCSILVHKKCVQAWHSNIDYGKIIHPGNLCCPQCKKPGRAEFMKFEQDVEAMLKIMKENNNWAYIICPIPRNE